VCSAVKPRFKVKPANTTAYDGHSLMMHCVAIGDPSPTVLWDKNDRVDAIDYRRFKVSSVLVPNSQNSTVEHACLDVTFKPVFQSSQVH